MDKVLRQDPFDMKLRQRKAPLHTALVPEAIFRGSHFERRFVTPFGTVWEKLAALIGEDAFGFGTTQHMVVGRVRQQCLDRIRRTLDDLDRGRVAGRRARRSWDTELQYARAGGGRWREASVNCDVHVSSAVDTPGLAFELEAALRNSDQTKVSKEKLLKTALHGTRAGGRRRLCVAVQPLRYRERHGWSFPRRWLNMREDRCVLIEDELWNKLAARAHTRPSLKSPRKWATLSARNP